jgi:hypothetical protein
MTKTKLPMSEKFRKIAVILLAIIIALTLLLAY